MPAKVMVSRTDHTPGQLRELARKHRFRDRRRRMRAIALVMEDGLSRTEVACGTPPGRGTAEAGGRAPAGAEAGLPAHVPAARPPEGGPRRPGGIPKGFRPVGAGGGARRRGPGGCARLPAGRGAGGAEGHAVKGPGQEGDAPARRAGSPVRTPVPVPPPACPATGDAVGHVCGRANTGETDRHLREIGERVPAGKRALVVPGGAGRHRSGDLGIPDSVSLLRLPPTARSSIRAGRCSRCRAPPFRQPGVRKREDVREVVEHVWNAFIGRKGEVTRVTTREWAVP